MPGGAAGARRAGPAAGLDGGKIAGKITEKIATLAAWPTAPAFTDRERVCLGYAEQFVLDPHGIGDVQAAEVTAHLGAPGLVALTEALALFEGFARFQRILGIEPAPDVHQGVEG